VVVKDSIEEGLAKSRVNSEPALKGRIDQLMRSESVTSVRFKAFRYPHSGPVEYQTVREHSLHGHKRDRRQVRRSKLVVNLTD
jgi:hypothetical protein